MAKPDLATVPQWYHKYVNRIEGATASAAIADNTGAALELLQSIGAEKWTFRYAEGKWSVKELVQHLIDSERIFSYRALCIARGEKASLPGFDENTYAAASKADDRTGADLCEEFRIVRKSTEALFATFDDGQLEATGIANNNPISVNSIGYIIAGHVQHHLDILRERYGV